MEIKPLIALACALILSSPLLRAQDTPSPSPMPSAFPTPSPLLQPFSPTSSSTPSASPLLQPSSVSLQPSPPAPIIAAQSTVVPASKLIGLLPEAPPGWTADKPDGSTTDSTGFPITTVSRVYAKGDADNAPTATINIIDSANNQQFQDSTKAIWNATSNTPEGYDKTVTVGGLPGFEHFTNADQTGVLWVVCGRRFFVQIETTRQLPSELEAWLPRIDLKKLATLR